MDDEKFAKYDVDSTAYMTLKDVLATQEEMQAMIEAMDLINEKYEKHHAGTDKAAAFKEYEVKFALEKKSIDLEVEITKTRNHIDDTGTLESQKSALVEKFELQIKEWKMKLEKTMEKLSAAKRAQHLAQVEYNEAKKAKEEAKEAYEQKIRDIYHNGKYTDAYTRVLNVEVSNIRAAEAKLLELIYSREIQPVHKEMDGVKVSAWRGEHDTEYLEHNFFRSKPHAVFYEKDQIIKKSNAALVDWLKPEFDKAGKGAGYKGPEVLVMVEGTAVFDKDGDYKW